MKKIIKQNDRFLLGTPGYGLYYQMEWDVATSWQLQGQYGNYRVYVAVKCPWMHVVLTGRLMEYALWNSHVDDKGPVLSKLIIDYKSKKSTITPKNQS